MNVFIGCRTINICYAFSYFFRQNWNMHVGDVRCACDTRDKLFFFCSIKSFCPKFHNLFWLVRMAEPHKLVAYSAYILHISSFRSRPGLNVTQQHLFTSILILWHAVACGVVTRKSHSRTQNIKMWYFMRHSSELINHLHVRHISNQFYWEMIVRHYHLYYRSVHNVLVLWCTRKYIYGPAFMIH